MSDAVYAVIAYIARYWFALLAVIIIWRAIIWLRKDADRVQRAQRKLPDAGYIGEWAVVASDAPGIRLGQVTRATRDGWIGSARACDIRIKNAAVPARAARFFLREDGLHVQPRRGGVVVVDGEPVRREAVLRHGATLTVGGITLQLRLFAGVILAGEKPARGTRRRRAEPVESIYAAEQDETEEGDVYEEEFEIEMPLDPDDAYEEDLYLPDEEQLGGEGVHIELPKPSLTVRNYRRRRH